MNDARHCRIAVRKTTFFWFLLYLPGCVAPPVFPPVEPPMVWPRSSETGRYAYVGSFSGEVDLKRPRSMWSWIGDLVGGRQTPAEIQRAPGVAASSSGVLFVADPDAQAIHRFDLEDREYRSLRDAGGGRPFVAPMGLALDREHLVASDRELGIVAVLSLDGEPRRILGEASLQGPVGVAIGPATGRVFVADVVSDRVVAFDDDGREVLVFGASGREPGLFNRPTHIACDAAENLYVADTLNCRVQVFDREGNFLRTWGHRGNAAGDFSQPKGIACDRDGRVYVVDSHFENVQVFSGHGELLLAFGEEGTGPGEFWLPVGVFVDEEQRIWVGDSFNRRVQVFRCLSEAPIRDEARREVP